MISGASAQKFAFALIVRNAQCYWTALCILYILPPVLKNIRQIEIYCRISDNNNSRIYSII